MKEPEKTEGPFREGITWSELEKGRLYDISNVLRPEVVANVRESFDPRITLGAILGIDGNQMYVETTKPDFSTGSFLPGTVYIYRKPYPEWVPHRARYL